jgi:enediyne biosynthesis protein E4
MRRRSPRWLSSKILVTLALAPSVAAATPITYHDIALDPSSGITYRRGPSSTIGAFDAVKLKPFMSLQELNASPSKSRGAPGVALLDYDRDGDLDIYATNGPGRANSLYQNQLASSGQATFVDVSVAAGVAAIDMDGTGVCYGDIDNDGDHDLMVLGRMEPNRLFRNNGGGTFTDITPTSGVGGGARSHTSCSIGDVNGDGLVDIFVANTWDWSRFDAIFNNSFAFNHTNDLYVNQGGNVFADASESSGIRVLHNVPEGDGTISWAVAMVDYDLDGDMDIMQADDQGALPPSLFAGVDRGFLQLLRNDGTGHFENVTATSGSTAAVSSWMGLSYGDLNCDGNLDFFSTSVGDYLIPQMGIPTPPGLDSSRWHLSLGSPSGAFTKTDLGALGVTPFGWGTGMADYDNDADTDIVFYGNLTINAFATADNPGVILANDGCTASFSWDQAATAATSERVERQDVQGLALGDLNNDGFVDIVHVSGQYAPETIPLVRMNSQWGSPFDATANFLPTFIPIGPLEWEWSGVEVQDGFLGVEISSGNNGNKWAKITVKGTKGLTTAGKVNRDGIGAIVKFTPSSGQTSMSPVLGGSSYSSQHALTQGFGLGSATQGTVEILWPGGTRNRLGGVLAGESLVLPEIPCNYAATWPTKNAYRMCVDNALNQLVSNNTITPAMRTRLKAGATAAYDAVH